MNKLKNINVLVTGASGFIGSHLTRRLVAEGATVSIFGRENNKNLEDIIDKLSVYKVDITKFEEVKKAIQDIKPKKVFTLAATTNLERSLEALKKEFKLSGGNQYRDFIYINDTVDGFIEASVNKKAIGNIINLSAGKGHIIKIG